MSFSQNGRQPDRESDKLDCIDGGKGKIKARGIGHYSGLQPGIPSFIARKQGKEEIKYDIPVMERYLKDNS